MVALSDHATGEESCTTRHYGLGFGASELLGRELELAVGFNQVPMDTSKSINPGGSHNLSQSSHRGGGYAAVQGAR